MQNLLFHSAFFDAPTIVVFMLLAILFTAAICDIKSYTIPHIFPYTVVALFAIIALQNSMSLSILSWHLLSVAIATAIGFLLFFFRLMGGGDIKLFSALSLWFFPLGLIGLVFCIAMTGVLISITIAIYKMTTLEVSTGDTLTIGERFHAVRKIRIPYGPAIALGSLFYFIFSNNLYL